MRGTAPKKKFPTQALTSVKVGSPFPLAGIKLAPRSDSREPLYPILNSRQQLRDRDTESPGEHRQNLDTEIPGAILGRADVRPVNAA